MSKDAVVIFDSHGTTNYDNGNEDYVTGAKNSYLCLTSRPWKAPQPNSLCVPPALT